MNGRAERLAFFVSDTGAPQVTTTGGNAGSPGCAGAEPGDEAVRLARAQRLFARLADALEGEIERLSGRLRANRNKSRAKAMSELIRETQRALMMVLDFEAKLDRRGPGDVDGALDLEAARAEITGRLDRLAERG